MDFRLGLFSLFLFLGIGTGLKADTHSPLQSDKKHIALNRYVAFSNECIHLMTDVRVRLEKFNVAAIEYLASDGANPLKFKIHDKVKHFEFKGSLQAPCTWMEGAAEPIVNLQHLYEETKALGKYIPESQKVKLNTTRNQMLYLMIEFLGVCDTLENYTTKGRYRTEHELKTAFWALKNCERIYLEFRDLTLALHDQVNAIADPPPVELLEMRDIIAHSREILRGVRYENPSMIRWQVIQLQAMINMIESQPGRTKKKLQAIGLDSRNSKSGYENMIIHARSIIKMANSYLNSESYDADYLAYGKGYYYFNNQLLDVYNHHKYGMLAYYNRFLSFSDIPMVKMIEEPPFFRVIYKFNQSSLPLATNEPEIEEPQAVSIALYAYRRTSKPEKPAPTGTKVSPAPATASTPHNAKPSSSIASKVESLPATPPAVEETILASIADKEIIAETSPVTNSNPEIEEPTQPLETNLVIIEDMNSAPAPTSPEPLGFDLPAAKYKIAKSATNHLVFLVDISSSMNKPEKLPLLQESLYDLVRMMRPEDHITLIVYSGRASIILEATSSARADYILRNLSTLSTGGKTNMGKGLKLAYKLAQEHYIPGGNNRVILASDGIVKINRRTSRMVKRMAWEDIALSTLHLTKGSSPSVKANLESLAKLGAGNYHHVRAENAKEVMLIEATAVMKN
ncbi:MAG: VWA domain-containing protein [Bacteroidota bacterium]